jgi:16S rRNA pseudouridine516 synthase
MKLAKYLANLGYGSRREVTGLLEGRRVRRRDGSVLRADDAFAHEDVLVDGEPLDLPPGSVVMLHKPVGYVCSTSEATRLVYELLPPRFLKRSPVLAPVGRLDRDTTGLLLLTDDGPLNHRITSPRTHLPKTYEALLARNLRGDEAEIFASGTLMLDNETEPLRPATLEALDGRRARVTLTEGRYHQLRRMFAAVGNHVEALHRSAVGDLRLGDLPPGGWRALDAEEVAALREAVGAR